MIPDCKEWSRPVYSRLVSYLGRVVAVTGLVSAESPMEKVTDAKKWQKLSRRKKKRLQLRSYNTSRTKWTPETGLNLRMMMKSWRNGAKASLWSHAVFFWPPGKRGDPPLCPSSSCWLASAATYASIDLRFQGLYLTCPCLKITHKESGIVDTCNSSNKRDT